MIAMGVVALLTIMIVPNVIKSREKSQLTAIEVNLKNIEDAKEQWAIQKKKGMGDIPNPVDISPFLKGGQMPTSLCGEAYQINGIGNGATAILPNTVKLGNYPAGATIRIP